MTTLTPFTRSANEIELRIARKVIRALRAAGNPVVRVWDGDTETAATTENDILNLVFNLDEAILYTRTGSFVSLVMGNEWDILSDYSVSLESALAPVSDYIRANW